MQNYAKQHDSPLYYIIKGQPAHKYPPQLLHLGARHDLWGSGQNNRMSNE